MSAVVLSTDGGWTLPAQGVVPLATVSVEAAFPEGGGRDVRLFFDDGLVTAGGATVQNAVLLAGGERAARPGECTVRLATASPGEEVCDNGVDDDGDGDTDLDDADCAGFPHPGDCIFFSCGCHYPFELFFTQEDHPFWFAMGLFAADPMASSFLIACRNAVQLSALEFTMASRPSRRGFTFEFVPEAEGAGDSAAARMADEKGNSFLPRLNSLTTYRGRIRAVEPGPDLLLDRGGFLSLDRTNEGDTSRLTFAYLASDSEDALIPANTARRDCAPTRLLIVHIEAGFRRGDADGDGSLNVTDAVATLQHLFMARRLPCLEAANANDDADIDLTDAVYALTYLFLEGAPPEEPGPADCGGDPAQSPSHLGCASYPAC